MTKRKKPRSMIFLFILILVSANVSGQDQNGTSSDVKGIIDGKRFIFHARSATPMKGGFVNLTSDYTIELRGDTLVCDLPYYGRTYQPSYNPSDAGFKFTSTKFSYESQPKKKGGWILKMKTSDQPSNRQFTITINQNLSTTVNVNCTDRQSISYNGQIDKKEK